MDRRQRKGEVGRNDRHFQDEGRSYVRGACRSFRGWKVCKWEGVALHRHMTFLAFAIPIFAR